MAHYNFSLLICVSAWIQLGVVRYGVVGITHLGCFARGARIFCSVIYLRGGRMRVSKVIWQVRCTILRVQFTVGLAGGVFVAWFTLLFLGIIYFR